MTRPSSVDDLPAGPTPAARRALLRAAPALAGLDDAVLDRLGARCEPLVMDAGEPLFDAGDESAGLYVVAEGQVRTFRASRDGAEQLLQVVGPGGALGDLPLSRGERHGASAATTRPTRLLFLSRHAVESIYRADADVAHALIESQARRLRDLALRAQALAFRDVLPRLALLLVGYADRGGIPATDGGVDVELGRTQEELAHEIGAARESVSRALGQLRDQGVVQPRRGHRVHIPDVQRLRQVAGV